MGGLGFRSLSTYAYFSVYKYCDISGDIRTAPFLMMIQFVEGVLRFGDPLRHTIHDIRYMTYHKALISGCVYYDVPRFLLWGILRWETSGEFVLWEV